MLVVVVAVDDGGVIGVDVVEVVVDVMVVVGVVTGAGNAAIGDGSVPSDAAYRRL